jgi:spore coat protein U-like protein
MSQSLASSDRFVGRVVCAVLLAAMSSALLSNFYIYGQIPALQDAAVGTYSDNIIATVDF